MTVATEEAAAPYTSQSGKGLKGGALGLLSNTVVATASVAPAYSMAAALGFVVAYVGQQAPIVFLLCFFPMAAVAVGYSELNKVMPDCGTTFIWGAKAFGPWMGWLGGWGIVAADVIVMANLAQIAAQYMFELFGAYNVADNSHWTLLAGVTWTVVMGLICYIGIEISADIQYGLLAIELVMLFVLSITALTKVYAGSAGHQAIHVQAAWFDPFHVHLSGFGLAMLTALFVYWGWDTAVSINEETRDKKKTPGRAALYSTLLLLFTYVLVSTSTQAFAGVGTKGIGLANPDNSGDVLSALGGQVFGTTGFGWLLSKLLVLMVLSSAASSTLTTILPAARTVLSMAVYQSIPAEFARIHRRFLTPTWSTVGVGVASITFYVAMTSVSTHVLADTIDSLGLMIAFYYGLSGFECVWWFRRDFTDSVRDFLMKGLIPFFGGVVLWFFMIYGAFQYWKPSYGYTSWTLPFSPHWHMGGTFLTGIAAILVGAVIMVVYRFVSPAFFKAETLDKDTAILVPES